MVRQDQGVRTEREENEENIEMLTLRGTVQGIKYFYAQTTGDGDVEIGGKGHIHEESCEYPRDCNYRPHVLATITWIPLAFSGIKAPYNGCPVEVQAYPPKKDGRLPTVKKVALVKPLDVDEGGEDGVRSRRGYPEKTVPGHVRYNR